MAIKPARQGQKTDWSELGAEMMRAGDWRAAIHAFTNASKAERTVAVHRYHLALAHLAAGDAGAAASELTQALRLKPGMKEASRQLGRIVASRALPGTVTFDRVGLAAALDDPEINRDQIAEAAVYAFARTGALAEALAMGRTKGWEAAARSLCLETTASLLHDELLAKALEDNIVRMPDLEQLLSALRRTVLIDLTADRFHDRALVRFVIALIGHCRTNEYVWDVSAAEEAALAATAIDCERLFSGDVSEGLKVLRCGLYRPLPDVIGPDAPLDQVRKIRPNAVRDLAAALIAAHADEQQRRRQMPQLAHITDATSREVAAQYADYPYPRWTSLGLLVTPADWKAHLAQHFAAPRLAFMERPFEVLIAGCGTGLQAIAAATAYGPNARVTAMDLSPASLAYASRMAERFGAKNVTFVAGDINDLPANAAMRDRFHVIECVGVLHHMARPFDGWRSLLGCLAQDGIILVGLYSEIARRRWTALKTEAAFPGEHCDDKAMRRYRAELFKRPDSAVGAEFKGIRDLYSASGFRDLILHVSEQRHTIPEIAAFLAESSLTFRGFTSPPDFDKLRARFPGENWPGRLECWAAFEQENPRTFANMYRFWCERA